MEFMKVTDPNHAFIVARIYHQKGWFRATRQEHSRFAALGIVKLFVSFVPMFLVCICPGLNIQQRCAKTIVFGRKMINTWYVFLFTSMLVYTSVDIANSSTYICYFLVLYMHTWGFLKYGISKTTGFFSKSCQTLDDLGIPPFHRPHALPQRRPASAGRQGATTETGVGMVSWRSLTIEAHLFGKVLGKSGDQVLGLCYLLRGE